MNLADMLSYTDIQELSRIANHYQCECSSHSKNELIQSILSTVNRKEVFEHTVHSLSLEDLRFLNSILFDQRDSFSLEELVARVSQTRFVKDDDDGRNPRDMILEFKRRGWLFNGFSNQTKFLFQVPQDLKKRISDVMAGLFLKQIVYLDEPEVYRDEHRLMGEDVFKFLEYLYHHEVALTVEGFMYKRSVQQILQSFSVVEEAVQKGGWRFGYGRRFKEYPSRFSLIYDYCYYNKLIQEHNNQLILSEAGKSHVLQKKKINPMELYRFWIRVYKVPIANIQSIAHWIHKLAGNWVTVSSLKETLSPFIKPFYYDTAEEILEQRVIQMMMHLGVVRLGESENSGMSIRLTPLGSSLIKGTYVSEEEQIDVTAES